LANRQDPDPRRVDVVQDLVYLGFRLADSEHDPAFGRISLLRSVGENRERPVVTGCFPNRSLETFNRFEIVVEDFGPSGEDRVNVVGIPSKIGDENLDGGIRATIVNRPDRRGPDRSAPVF